MSASLAVITHERSGPDLKRANNGRNSGKKAIVRRCPDYVLFFTLAVKDWLPFVLVLIVGILVGLALKHRRR
jgi:hypothetical protein